MTTQMLTVGPTEITLTILFGETLKAPITLPAGKSFVIQKHDDGTITYTEAPMTPEPKPLEIIPGQHYRTRGGHRWRCYATDGADGKIHGAILLKDGWVSQPMRSVGRYHMSGDDSGYDLIAPWTDEPEVDWPAMPAWAEWVARDEDGDWWFHEVEPMIDHPDDDYWSVGDGTVGQIPTKYAPKFIGDWKQSKVKRPEAK